MRLHYWRTKTGELIRPRSMGDGHLLNTTRFIERKFENRMSARILALMEGYDLCKAPNQLAWWHETLQFLMDMQPEDVAPIYPELLYEIDERGLQRLFPGDDPILDNKDVRIFPFWRLGAILGATDVAQLNATEQELGVVVNGSMDWNDSSHHYDTARRFINRLRDNVYD